MKTKKELKDTYKKMKTPMGVFQIKNAINNRLLIDNSTNMTAKWNRHKMELNVGSHRNQALQKEWNEHGADQFVFSVISELKAKDEDQVNYREELRVLQDMILEELRNKEHPLYN